jgi:hypothetical protein
MHARTAIDVRWIFPRYQSNSQWDSPSFDGDILEPVPIPGATVLQRARSL